MKLKGSHIFYSFVVLLVASVYYFDYYRGEETQKKKDSDSVLIPILKSDVAKIELKNSTGEFELQKTEAGWSLTKPIADLASLDDVDGWIQSLTTEKSVEKIGEGESFEWSTYGLDKPTGTLTVTPKTGSPIKLELSGKRNFEGSPFIRKNDEKVVFVGGAIWSSLLGRGSKDFRDKRVLRSTLGDLETVSLIQGKVLVQFKMTEGKWQATGAPTWKLDQNKVRESLNAIQEMKANDFVVESDPTKAQLLEYGLEKPALKVVYTMKDKKEWTADFGQNKSKSWYMWIRDMNKIALVPTEQVEKMVKANINEMRDREEPFVFNKEDVKKLNISGDQNIELSKEGEAWKASIPGKIEGQDVSQFLDKMRQLRVAEFLDGKSSVPGLAKARKQFVLADTQGKSLFQLTIGESFKKKDEKNEKVFYYAKSSGYPDVVLLKEEDVKGLEAGQLVKAEKKAAENPQAPTQKK